MGDDELRQPHREAILAARDGQVRDADPRVLSVLVRRGLAEREGRIVRLTIAGKEVRARLVANRTRLRRGDARGVRRG